MSFSFPSLFPPSLFSLFPYPSLSLISLSLFLSLSLSTRNPLGSVHNCSNPRAVENNFYRLDSFDCSFAFLHTCEKLCHGQAHKARVRRRGCCPECAGSHIAIPTHCSLCRISLCVHFECQCMTPVGFEPTQLALVELESTPLDHSGKVS